MSLLLGYLVIGYIVALIFASFFTKIFVMKCFSGDGKLEIKGDKPCSFIHLPWAHVIVVLINADDEILFSGSKIVFSIKLGWLFLVSALIWPVFLVILSIMILGKIFGKQLPSNELLD